MTKVITRYFDSADQAKSTRDALLYDHRLPERAVKLFERPDGIVDALTSAKVKGDTAKAYEGKMSKGGAVLLVFAGYRPLGVARITRDVTAKMGAADMGDLVQEVEVKDGPGRTPSVLSSHPLLMTTPRKRGSSTYHMAEWPIPLIIRRRPNPDAVLSNHPHITASLWPLISRRKPKDKFAFPRHARMANWPIPLIGRRKPYDKFAFPRHARMADWPIPLLSRRKPYNRSIFPRHQHMANVPFPLLINGKTGTNALLPGQPHMANGPLPLLSKREPADKFAFPRHVRMANWPIPLISRRKPSDKFAFPRHAHMADKFLPLIIRRDEDLPEDKNPRNSFSKMLGMPTVIRR